MKNVFCSFAAPKPTIRLPPPPPPTLYTSITLHLLAYWSSNITCWFRPLCIFSFPVLSQDQVIPHHFFLLTSLLPPPSSFMSPKSCCLGVKIPLHFIYCPKSFLISLYTHSLCDMTLHYTPISPMDLNIVCKKLVYFVCFFH